MEKPAGVNSREVEEVRLLAEKKGLPVFLCFTWRHMPTTRFLKDVIDSGAVGKVYHCYIKCIKESGLWEGRRLEWRFDEKYAGTGVLCDLGSHMIDFLSWMNEKIVGLSANRGTFIKERQKLDSDEWAPVTTDDYANNLADLSSGATANIELSRCAKTEDQLVEFIIYGEKGYIRFCNYVGEGLEICYGDKETIAKGKVRVATPEKYGTPGEIYQSQSFIDMANGKTDNFTSTIDDGLEAQLVIDAVIRADREKRYVTVEEIRRELK
jgi:predicted dehydrogenase